MIDHRISHWIIGLLLFGACHDPVLVSDSEEDLSSLQDTITLIFGGDIMCHKPQVTSAQKDSTYDFSGVFQYVEPIISEADIGFVNLETTLSSTGPYTGYPGFKSPDELVHAVSEAGFDVVVTANNHSNDTRAKGLIHTIDVLRSLGLYHTGTFIDSLDKALNYPLMIKHEGISIALLNYTYSTNGVPTTTPTLVNVIDSTQLKSDIRLAKSHHPDLIIAFMHWGSQYRIKPNYKQRRLSKMMIREGVDHIIGAHPHVVQPIEIIKDEKGDHLIAYSLGNFISNQKKPLTDGGIMLRMRLVRDQNNIQLDHYDVVPIWRYIRAGNKNTFEVIPTSLFKSDTSHFHTMHSYLNMVKHDSYIESFFTEK